MTEKSAVDVIYEIHAMLTDLTARVALMDKNINILQDKANGQLFPDLKIPHKVEPALRAPEPTVKPVQIEGPKTTRVFGKVLNNNKPTHGVNVIVRNPQNREVVKQTKTNMAGEWNAFLSPGKYTLEYRKELMSPAYRIIEVKEGERELEVI